MWTYGKQKQLKISKNMCTHMYDWCGMLTYYVSCETIRE